MIPVTEDTSKLIDKLDNEGVVTGYGRTPEGIEFYTVPVDVETSLEPIPTSEETVKNQEAQNPVPPPGIVYKEEACFSDKSYIMDPRSNLPILRPGETKEDTISTYHGPRVTPYIDPADVRPSPDVLSKNEALRARKTFEGIQKSGPFAVLTYFKSGEDLDRAADLASLLMSLLDRGISMRTGKSSNVQGKGGFKEVADRQTASQRTISEYQKIVEKELGGKTELNLRMYDVKELEEYMSISGKDYKSQ